MKKFTFRTAAATLAACTLVAAGSITPAFAADPKQYFELDGNILSDGSTPGPDWSDIFLGSGAGGGATPKSPLPDGFSSPTFVQDFNPTGTNDNSTYATGSKDTLNITPGWQCTKSNNVNDKTDIVNAYAVAYNADVSGTPHLMVYFALEVAANEGTKDVAFWFLKDSGVGCTAGNKATAFTGNHTDGDVLIVSEYTSGGRVSTIKAYVWSGGPTGFLNPNAIGSGGDCRDGAFDVCARTNGSVLNGDGATPDVPWLVKTKTSNPQGSTYNSSKDLDLGEFFEGGIDLTALGISGCFNRYLADTRSSTSLTATIFDYALGNFSNCSIGLAKTCQGASVRTETSDFSSPFQVVITNTSPSGAVHDVSFNETFNFANTGETSCKITSNTGDQSVNDTELIGAGPVKVTSSLDPGASVTIGITCVGALNSFQNSVHATAGSAAGQSDITKDAAVLPESATACQGAVTGGLQITKVCRGMELVSGSNGLVALKANVRVTVTNDPDGAGSGTSNEKITITSLVDNKVGGSGTVGNFVQVPCVDGQVVPDLELSPGETACFDGSYNPTNADLVNPPSSAGFTDTATVEGVGSISGVFPPVGSPPITASATCLLCDSDNDGIPDVTDH